MNRATTLLVLVLAGAVGCSGGQSSDSASDAAAPAQASHPAAQVADDFLSAAVAGDAATATGQLTPRAVEQFKSQGKAFSFPGLDGATFRIGEVRQPSENNAVVQCLLTAKSGEGEEMSEELCCLLRLVGQQWRVSGIAYDAGGSQQPMILDFENIKLDPPANPPESQAGARSPDSPRTAQSPDAGAAR